MRKVRLRVPATKSLVSPTAVIANLDLLSMLSSTHGETYPGSTVSGILYGVRNYTDNESIPNQYKTHRKRKRKRTAEKGYNISQSELYPSILTSPALPPSPLPKTLSTSLTSPSNPGAPSAAATCKLLSPVVTFSVCNTNSLF